VIKLYRVGAIITFAAAGLFDSRQAGPSRISLSVKWAFAQHYCSGCYRDGRFVVTAL